MKSAVTGFPHPLKVHNPFRIEYLHTTAIRLFAQHIRAMEMNRHQLLGQVGDPDSGRPVGISVTPRARA
jgi:hypothetical protein